MIHSASGSVIEREVDAIVNTVNTVGVMGKGVALQVKQAFPSAFRAYKAACDNGDVRMGSIFVTPTERLQPRFIFHFPTKEHWRANSKYADIQAGLRDLRRLIQELQITSIAIPPLGCGHGGLDWARVRPLIVGALDGLDDVEILLFAPSEGKRAERPVVRTRKPRMTLWRAALLKCIEGYRLAGFDASHIEAQKLLYLLAVRDKGIKHRFAKDRFGPYDRGARQGILEMEGHYITGFGDGEINDIVTLLPGASEVASEFLKEHKETVANIEQVLTLIDGFEDPHGLELLSTVHWVGSREGASSANEAIELTHAWNERKRNSLRSEHIRIAWSHLNESGWLAPESD